MRLVKRRSSLIKRSISGLGNSYQKLIGVQSIAKESQRSIFGSPLSSPTIKEEDEDEDLIDEVAAREWRSII